MTTTWAGPSQAQWLQSAQVLYHRADVAETDLLRWVDHHTACRIAATSSSATMGQQSIAGAGSGMQQIALAIQNDRGALAAARVDMLQALNAMLRKARAYPESVQEATRRLDVGLSQLAEEAATLESAPHEANVLLATLERDMQTEGAGMTASARQHFGGGGDSNSYKTAAAASDAIRNSFGGGGSSDVSQRHASFLAANGGPTLGWADDDHRKFLRSIMNSSGKASLEVLEALLEILPHFSREELSVHLQRYAQHMEFVEQKRLALAAFRAQKDADAVNECEVQAIRQQLLQAQVQTAEMVKERKRLQHHQALHRKLSEWKAKKSKEVGGASSCWHADVKAVETRQRERGINHAAVTRSASLRSADATSHRAKSHPHALTSPDAEPVLVPARNVTRASDLQKRYEADMERVALRRGRIELVQAKTNTTRADVTAGIAERLVAGRRAASSDPGRLTRLTESAASRRASHADPTSHTMGGSATTLRDMPSYLTPRNAQGTHRASANWCSKTHQRL